MSNKIFALAIAGLSCGMLCYGESVTAMDRNFMDKAARGGIAEVQLGQLASQKANSQAVKNFGQKMVQDHTQANDKLQTIASNDKVTLPSAMDAKDQALYNRLSGLNGDAFDKAYMRAMIQDHVQDVSEFRRESRGAHDQQVRTFASDTLPTLEDHLKMAKEVGSQVGVASAGVRNTGTESARR